MTLNECTTKVDALNVTSTMTRKELEKICKAKNLPLGNTFVMRHAIAATIEKYGKI